ncbi:Tat (twin-arginine translocation) pathway signal sequence [Salipaludibacillus keqinensis]|uniref:Tat (Twin-arginine translocation) pathway signal sequence n=1 Tax=Salipaludibacillus keqinensis TaxID=2045207 RepID=A0A323TZ34_9BACI|nr:M14 family zinc carboxypeptidase [Salipaludibacillus keqinensis]PYZ94845.1 Tat (twin-arginine translocation) pathway signal sequence [Salipaludibacillus keqinensis]
MRKTVISLLSLFMLLSVFASSAFAVQNHPSTKGETNLSSIQTYDGMIKELESLEKRSKGKLEVFTLADKGYEYNQSEQGRDLYVAKIGNGPKKVWVQSRIHGDEPYGTEATIQLLQMYTSNQSAQYREVLDELTLYFAPMYNPDGSEMNIRQTVLQDGSEKRVDLNRDWAEGAFEAVESKAWYSFWADIQPDYGLDIHHQGLKTDSETGQAITMSLGISLAPGGPTLPYLEDGLYEDITRQMQVHVYDALKGYGFTNIDRYTVGGNLEIDIRGGVVSAMMLGLNYEGLNEDNHSHPAIFFETSGNTREGNLGQRGRGHNIRQNTLGIQELLHGLATEEVYDADPERWDEIPHPEIIGYFTDHSGIVPVGY